MLEQYGRSFLAHTRSCYIIYITSLIDLFSLVRKLRHGYKQRILRWTAAT